jgi:hypothetical protein
LCSSPGTLSTESLEGVRDGYRTIRAELAEQAPPHAVDATLKAYRTEGRRLAATEQAVELVERALRGEAVKTDGESPIDCAAMVTCRRCGSRPVRL